MNSLCSVCTFEWLHLYTWAVCKCMLCRNCASTQSFWHLPTHRLLTF